MTNIELSYRSLLNNVILLELKGNNSMLHQGIEHVKDQCVQIESLLLKFNNRKTKRALVNALGTVIKYITGNPDENDLDEINKNINSLYDNQHEIIEQIDKYSSFANHITARYSTDLKLIESNVNSTLSLLQNMSNILEMQLFLQYNYYLSSRLLNILRIIERTISLAFSDITNIEVMSNTELIKIKEHLSQIYKNSELIDFRDAYLFKILEFSKFRVISINDTITCMLYVPILKPPVYQYTKVYPLPNSQNVVLIPPAQYHLQALNSILT